MKPQINATFYSTLKTEDDSIKQKYDRNVDKLFLLEMIKMPIISTQRGYSTPAASSTQQATHGHHAKPLTTEIILQQNNGNGE
jgi:hypothetical protein